MKGLHQKKMEGTITVFLSLILLLIVALLFTLIEGARVNTAKVYAERSLTTAMDSVLAQYYGPLWEEYHIFGYYNGNPNDAAPKAEIEDQLLEYMKYTFEPNTGMAKEEYVDFFSVSTDQIDLEGKTGLMDYEGELFINEAVEYMKYKEIGNAISLLLDKFSLLETPKKVSYLSEEKLKVEEELVEIDQGILRLMELLDGLKTSTKGIEVGNGKLATTPNFIKKICYGEPTKVKVGINQDSVYQAIRYNYIDPNSYFNDISNCFIQINNLLDEISGLKKEQETQGQELVKEQEELVELSNMENQTLDIKNRIKELRLRIEEIEESIREKEDKITRCENQSEVYLTLIGFNHYEIFQLITKVKPLLEQAIKQIELIELKTDTARPIIKQFEEILTQEKETLSSEVYESFAEDLEQLKKYVNTGNSNYDFLDMKQILKNNQDILISTEKMMEQAEEFITQKLYSKAEDMYQQTNVLLKDYQIDGLELDYSSLVLDRSQQEDPLEEVNQLLQGSITNLVVDASDISDSNLSSTAALPSEIAALSQGNPDILTELKAFFEGSISEASGTGTILKGLDRSFDITNILGNGINLIAEKFLYSRYLQEHFDPYKGGEGKEINQKPSVLQYELEYLLSGKKADSENLSSVITKILLLRTVLDFVSLLGDKVKCQQAKAIAASLVGFTGLTILVSITQILILITWAFAEALLDTSALMMGKEVPILKKRVELEFTDLFMINRDFLKQKAASMMNSGEVTLTYNEYLTLFLLLKDKKDIIYRAMDLIQENIRLRYQEAQFQIEHCIYGIDVSSSFSLEKKFINSSFVSRFLKSTTDDFQMMMKATYSY